MTPIRVQRKRTKGFKLPENTVCVTRGTKYGNPFKVGTAGIDNNSDAASRYERWLEQGLKSYLHGMPPTRKEILLDLKGKNLACFCALDKPCHADILLKIANE